MVYTILCIVSDQNTPGACSTVRRGARGEDIMQRQQVESGAAADTSTAGESSNDNEEEGPAVGDAAATSPSSIRKAKGVWSAVGRAIDSLMGTIGTGGPHHHSESGLESSHPSDEQGLIEQDHEHRHQRPPTDDELIRARMVGSPSSESGYQPQQQHTSEVGSSPEFEAPLASGTTTVKVPISLTPMQPPPDVLAAMKGRRREAASVGRRRPRFSAPPADVVAALEKTRKTTSLKNRGVAAHDEDREHEHEDCSADNM